MCDRLNFRKLGKSFKLRFVEKVAEGAAFLHPKET